MLSMTQTQVVSSSIEENSLGLITPKLFGSANAATTRIIDRPTTINIASNTRLIRGSRRSNRSPISRSDNSGISKSGIDFALLASVDQLTSSDSSSDKSNLDAYSSTKRGKEKSREIAKNMRDIRNVLPIMKVESIKYKLMTYDDLNKINPIIIDNPEKRGNVPRSINDPRMGTMNPQAHCANLSCLQDQQNCHGHMGAIILNHPILDPFNRRRVLFVLQSVCKDCGSLLLDEETIRSLGIDQFSGDDRLKMLAEKSIQQPCQRRAEEFLRVTTCTRAKKLGIAVPLGPNDIGNTMCQPTVLHLNNMVKAKTNIGLSKDIAISQVSDDIDAQYKQKMADDIEFEKEMKKHKIVIIPGKEIDCGINPIYLPEGLDKGIIIYKHNKSDIRSTEMPIEEILCLFETISSNERTIKGLGFDPLGMILCAVPVIPPCARKPSMYEAAYDTDLVGSRYISIIQTNNSLNPANRAKAIEENKKTDSVQKLRNELVHRIGLLYTNPIDANSNTSRDAPGISQSMSGKEGTFRQNVEGNRVDFSARSVASPDPTMKFGQVGLPISIARILTYPEVVTPINRDALQKLLRDGKVTTVIRGVLRDNQIKIRIADNNRDDYILSYGETVERWLHNGDYVLVNRQPTLHASSMMGHEVVLHPGLTIKIDLSATSPYNADFDGDELNVHAPTTVAAAVELQGIKNIINNIMDPESGKPAMALVMDTLTAAYRLTVKNVDISHPLWNDLMFEITSLNYPDFLKRLRRHEIRPLSGKALISSMLPADFYYKKGRVLIIDGILKRGAMTKQHLGRAHGSIIQYLWKRYGPQRTAQFLTDTSRVLNRWQAHNPFSVGLRDMPQSDELLKMKKIDIAKGKMIANQLGGVLNDPIEENRREQQLTIYANRTEAMGAKVMKDYLKPDNAFNLMAIPGAKGDKVNISQIVGSVGQQNVFGKRFPKELKDGTVCLSYFDSDDNSPETRGYCESSYLQGLTPPEFFFAQWAGREGLVNTAISTSDTGFLGRKINKSLEDLIVRQDGSVRNAADEIIQYTYGGDGLSSSELMPMEIIKGEEKIRWFVDIDNMASQINASFGYYNEK